MTQREIIKELLRAMQPLLNRTCQQLEDTLAGYGEEDPHLLDIVINEAKAAMKAGRKAIKK